MTSAPPFFTRYGLSRTGDSDVPLELEPYPEICRAGVVLPAVLASVVDIVGSLYAREIAGRDATFTTDLSVRAPARFVPERIRARGALLRSGRTMITTSVLLEASGEPFAYGETSFMRVPRQEPDDDPARVLGMPEVIPRNPLSQPLVDEVGIEVVDAGRGQVEVELRDALRNPEGVMQGALVALLAEVAALTLAEHAHVVPQIVTELDVRYLAVAKAGPIQARADWVGAPADGMLRVLLRDLGNAERVTASVLLRAASTDAAEGRA